MEPNPRGAGAANGSAAAPTAVDQAIPTKIRRVALMLPPFSGGYGGTCILAGMGGFNGHRLGDPSG